MKYQAEGIQIPKGKRKEINDKVLHIIDNSLVCDITREDIFNSYTGDGGLHDLDLKSFNNFHEFTEAKKEIEQGQFFTPPDLCQFLVECVRPGVYDFVADLTFGMGNFFNYLPVEENAYGTELDIKAFKVAKHLYPNANLKPEDIRFYNPGVTFDIIFGNPPFNLKWKVGKDEYLSQLYYCYKAYELLKPAGILALIVPGSFLNDDFMDGNFIKEIDARFNFLGQFDLPVNSFKALGVDIFPTKAMFFQKKSQYLTDSPYTTAMLPVPGLDRQGAEEFYSYFIKPAMEQKEKLKSKLFLEHLRAGHTSQDFEFKVKKLLFAIKSHPRLKSYYAKCFNYVNEYYTQKMPEGMKYEEWEKVRITPNKVISYLNKYLQKQHEREVDKIQLVKTNYGLRLKAYSRKTKQLLAKNTGCKKMSFNDMVLNEAYPFDNEQYKKLWQRKMAQFKKQDTSMKELPGSVEVRQYLDEFRLIKKAHDYSLFDNTQDEIITLNDIQKTDLEKVINKKYDILNWQQGSGKTIAGIAWYHYLLEKTNIRNIFVVSAAISINLTWDVELKKFSENYIKVESLSDINKIKPGQVVLITSGYLIKYQKHIKKYIRQQSQKIGLVVDESDEFSNALSNRTKAILNCFRKVQYKIFLTGTTTRNNVNDLYSQLELLYNNSINMLCECQLIYKLNKENEIEEELNPYYMKPFPAYKGRNLFKNCFNPYKTTVFGIKKHNQDIYNMVQLQHLIEKTIITRKFKDVVGRKLYDIKTHRIYQNEAEREVYRVIMKEFHQMLYLFRSTGSSKKDSMLKLIRQIQLLIKSTSIPHHFKEYTNAALPSKYTYIFDLVKKFSNEKVAIGTIFVPAAQDYYEKLAHMFPDRPVFLIKGNISFKKRKANIADFEASQNGILVSTQQSLKSSVNIPSCNKVIIESLPWNLPKAEQYYFRFIRYNSKDFKEVHFVIYENTIDTNLMGLLIAKEKINEFIKTLEFKDDSDIFNEYDIDLDLLSNMIEKYKDDEGRLHLSWGQQKAV